MAARGFLLRTLYTLAALLPFLASASFALSQCDASPFKDSHTGTWQGWGSVWSSIAGNPYTATFHYRTEKKLPDGTLQVWEWDSNEARDSQGRQYRSSTSKGLVNGKLGTVVSVNIFDPVCGYMIEWRTDSKAASITHLIPAQPGQGRWRPDIPAAPRTEKKNGVETLIEPLGTKQILGLEALGIRYSTFIPVGSLGQKEPVHVLTERWDSPELEIMVEHLMDDPRTSAGRRHMQMVHLDRSEPDMNLFRIPAGYAIEKHYAPATENGPEIVPGWK